MPAPRASCSTEISPSGRSASSPSAVARIARSRSSPLARTARRPRAVASRAGEGSLALGGAVGMPRDDTRRRRTRQQVEVLNTVLISCAAMAVSPAIEPEREHVDVLIVGAGLSGIGAACHLRRHCPGKSLAILESREAIGGTWDLFRYPGIRS